MKISWSFHKSFFKAWVFFFNHLKITISFTIKSCWLWMSIILYRLIMLYIGVMKYFLLVTVIFMRFQSVYVITLHFFFSFLWFYGIIRQIFSLLVIHIADTKKKKIVTFSTRFLSFQVFGEEILKINAKWINK